MPTVDSMILDLPGFKIIDVTQRDGLTFHVEYEPRVQCPHCCSESLRTKDTFVRRIRHTLMGQRPSWLSLKAHKFQCRGCSKYFNSRFPGIKPRRRATEPCRNEVTKLHHNGWDQHTLSRETGLSPATVEKWYQDHFDIKNRELIGAHCPRVLGIDEHFFTRKDGYATTLADLAKRKVFDIALGRSETSLRAFLKSLVGKEKVRVLVMDLSEGYRSLAKKHFPNALIVADRFHVIRLVNQQFVKTWGLLHEEGRKHRGLLSLMRRHPNHFKPGQRERLFRYLNEVPGLKPIYLFWQDLLRLLRRSGCNQAMCREILPEFIWMIEELRRSSFQPLALLGHTLSNWMEEIARMFRFSKTNSITEGLHNRMEMISRDACGFRNFSNYRLRVRVLCR